MSWNERKKEENSISKQFKTRNFKKNLSGIYNKIQKTYNKPLLRSASVATGLNDNIGNKQWHTENLSNSKSSYSKSISALNLETTDTFMNHLPKKFTLKKSSRKNSITTFGSQFQSGKPNSLTSYASISEADEDEYLKKNGNLVSKRNFDKKFLLSNLKTKLSNMRSQVGKLNGTETEKMVEFDNLMTVNEVILNKDDQPKQNAKLEKVEDKANCLSVEKISHLKRDDFHKFNNLKNKSSYLFDNSCAINLLSENNIVPSLPSQDTEVILSEAKFKLIIFNETNALTFNKVFQDMNMSKICRAISRRIMESVKRNTKDGFKIICNTYMGPKIHSSHNFVHVSTSSQTESIRDIFLTMPYEGDDYFVWVTLMINAV